LYQTSPRPFNEEVDFFDFLAELGTRYHRYHTTGSIKKKRTVGSDGDFGTNDGAGGFVWRFCLVFFSPTTVLKVQAQTMVKVQARTTLEVYGDGGSFDGRTGTKRRW